MRKRVLLIAFHYPPSTLSSGHLRPLALTQHLPEMGWEPLVLAATAFSYGQKDPDTVQMIPSTCRVYRAPALDAKRHLGLCGKYPAILARPDRWASWWPAAICTGLYLVKRYRPQVIWSTYPIMTTHLVAHRLNRLTGIPWIADFRDPIRIPANADDRRERRIVSSARYCVFTAPSAKHWYAQRYPELERAGRFHVIGNGYDEKLLAGLPERSRRSGEPLVLLHSGVLYPDGRDPTPFFKALARLKADGTVTNTNLRVVLRGCGLDSSYNRELARLGLESVVTLDPPISNSKALAEQAGADGLLLFQGPKFDRHIPAKIYEYLRIGRPIFALVGANGDSADLLRTTGGAHMVAIDDIDAIEKDFRQFIGALETGDAPCVAPEVAAKYSRREGSKALADLLDRAVAEGAR